LASGVATVVVNDKNAEARFVVLRVGLGGDGVMEVFREPDAHDEMLAVDLSISGGATAEADKESLTILLTGSLADCKMRLCCVGMEEFTKWTGGLRSVGFDFPEY